MKWLLFAMLFWANGVYAEKTPILSRNVGVQVSLAFKHYEQDKLIDAFRVLNKVTTKAGFDKAYVDRFRANLYWSLNQQEQAITMLESAVAQHALVKKEQLQSQRMLADLYLNAGQTNKAIDLYLSLINTAPDKGLYQNLAQAYYQTQAWKRLIPAADKAIALSVQFDKSVHLLQLSAFYKLQYYKKATAILTQLTQTYPTEKRWWMQLAAIYNLREDHARTLSTYELAYARGHLDSANQVKTLARLRANQGAPYQAAQLLELSLDKGLLAKNSQLYKEIAGYWQLAREHGKAQQYWGKSAQLSGNGKHYLMQAQLLALLGQYDAMLSSLNKINTQNNTFKAEVALLKVQAVFELKRYQQAFTLARLAANYPSVEKRALAWLRVIENKLQSLQVAVL